MCAEKEELVNIAPFLFCNKEKATQVRVNVIVCSPHGEECKEKKIPAGVKKY